MPLNIFISHITQLIKKCRNLNFNYSILIIIVNILITHVKQLLLIGCFKDHIFYKAFLTHPLEGEQNLGYQGLIPPLSRGG